MDYPFPFYSWTKQMVHNWCKKQHKATTAFGKKLRTTTWEVYFYVKWQTRSCISTRDNQEWGFPIFIVAAAVALTTSTYYRKALSTVHFCHWDASSPQSGIDSYFFQLNAKSMTNADWHWNWIVLDLSVHLMPVAASCACSNVTWIVLCHVFGNPAAKSCNE